jgi:hypothetical protein
MEPSASRYAHLARMTDSVGLAEHCRGTRPSWELGYCVDDVARALVVLARDPAPDAAATALAELYLQFVLDAVSEDGRVHNRRAWRGAWTDAPDVGDWWGRGLWALGTVVAYGTDSTGRALSAFDRAARRRSPHLRALAYAGVGAAEVLSRHPDHDVARRLLADAATEVAHGRPDDAWPWPEPRLRYANAVLPEVLVAAAVALGDMTWHERGLRLLDWLVATETVRDGRGSRLSVTPVAGWGLGEPRPGFDQQPIEAAALAEASARAWSLTREDRWRETVLLCEAWFDGRNDRDVVLADPVSGGCCDGLTGAGRNENQGAESTLALLAVRQLARRVGGPAGSPVRPAADGAAT